MPSAIELRGLTRDFGSKRAVDHLDLTLEIGEVLGFLGPNGAGKTTSMRMITGFLPPSAGHVRVMGRDIETEGPAARAAIGYLPEGAPLYPDMEVLDFLVFCGRLRGMSGKRLDARLEDAVDRLDLEEVLFQRIETLSKGYKRRVGLAQAILHDPPVLILDEPTDGLDPNQKRQVRALIAAMAKDKAIVISTHILEEVEAVCSRAIIIGKGRKLADDTPDGLLAQSEWRGAVSLKLEPEAVEAAAAILRDLPAIARIEALPRQGRIGRLVAFASNGQNIAPLIEARLINADLPPVELTVEQGRLDDVFRRLTGGAA